MNPIREFRRRTGLSREDFALALGVGYWALSRIERGVTAAISPQLAERLRALGYPGDPRVEYLAWRKEVHRELLARMKES